MPHAFIPWLAGSKQEATVEDFEEGKLLQSWQPGSTDRRVQRMGILPYTLYSSDWSLLTRPHLQILHSATALQYSFAFKSAVL